ncbi:hypothetical protein PHET_11320, partial [Paragonimus heterotremus]
HSALQEAQWTADSLVPNCSQCHVAFSVSRRRVAFVNACLFREVNYIKSTREVTFNVMNSRID